MGEIPGRLVVLPSLNDSPRALPMVQLLIFMDSGAPEPPLYEIDMYSVFSSRERALRALIEKDFLRISASSSGVLLGGVLGGDWVLLPDPVFVGREKIEGLDCLMTPNSD